MEYTEAIGYRSSTHIKARLENISYYPFHLHNDAIEIICVLDGRIKIYDSAAEYILSSGGVHIFNKNDPHKIQVIHSTDISNIVLTIQFDTNYYEHFLPELMDAYFITDTDQKRDPASADLKLLKQLLAQIYIEDSRSGSDIVIQAYGKRLVQLLLDRFQDYVYHETPDKTAHIVRLQNTDRVHRDYERMYRIVDYICYHYSEKITLAKLAEMEFLSVPHLSQYLKSSLGLSFTEILSLTRCEEACRLLSDTHKNVDEIAAEVGYSTRRQLAIHFRRWFHQTPTEYRQMILRDLKNEVNIVSSSCDIKRAEKILERYLRG